jgi:hypothetical protein
MGIYQLYCFGESGNSYKTALMLELARLAADLGRFFQWPDPYAGVPHAGQ